MSARRSVFAVLALLIALVVAIIGIEGLFSLFANRSAVRSLSGGEQEDVRQRMTHEERLRAALLTEGPYAVALDPAVGMRLKGNLRRQFHDVDFTTDEWGMRTRPGAAPAKDAFRIVVLGDSVAFGYGVADGETFGARLEEALGAAAASTPSPVVFTVACPGWNFLNSSTYLINHLDRLAPDLVVFIPVENDLDNSFGVLETGHRSVDHDPVVGVGAPRAALGFHHRLLNSMRALLGRDVPGAADHGMNWVMTSGVFPESARRYDHMVHGLTSLRDRLASRGGRLAVCMTSRGWFERRLEQRLRAAENPVDAFGLFRVIEAQHQLVGDPHFNADFIRAGARRMARSLVERGMIPGIDGGKLPRPDPSLDDNVFPRLEAAALRDERRADDARVSALFGPEVRLQRGIGYNQVYGGLWGDSTMGIAAMVGLRRAGAKRLRCVLRRIESRPSIYPLDLEIEVNGIALESARIPSLAEDDRANIPVTRVLPEELRDAESFDVVLRASHRAATRFQQIDALASVRVLHIELR